MPTKRELEAFIAKQTKSSKVLHMLMNHEYITSSDIIQVAITTCPHKLIETLRKNFGYDFVLSREKRFFRKQCTSKGKVYKVADTYFEYFIPEGGICQLKTT